jgi:hypothetical protein
MAGNVDPITARMQASSSATTRKPIAPMVVVNAPVVKTP